MRVRAAFSPASSTSASGCNLHVSKVGSGSEAHAVGDLQARTRPCGLILPAFAHALAYAEKTRKGSPDELSISPGSWTVASQNPAISIPASSPNAETSASTRRPNGSGSRLKKIACAPVSLTSFASSSTALPRRITKWPPIAARFCVSDDKHPHKNCCRFAPVQRCESLHSLST